ncbi:MAG: methylenetetrahydrofolate--tRNA-(uracil(54)-C(5))-methyltransferase (FADH(2)-oxidizing) TrmFO, partial [SAR324 cluster bacterium]|nr:methylenetetrahydrofolate--tRNA-(uracil(54)-C(5))-methyltransferase (FADH(2)-oxidizing) TrmFO [SAR324 cluster bacterium]
MIIGGGLAGSEAAWQLAKRGFNVALFEMRPKRTTKAHKTGKLAELVCSNSLRGAALSNAVGLLKEELRLLDSLVMRAADECRVPAGGALAVDRELFSSFINDTIRSHPQIDLRTEEVTELPVFSREQPLIIASGPLTSPELMEAIKTLTGTENLAFFDAISPIVLNESLDHSKLFFASRYGKGDGNEYLNIPLNKDEYESFVTSVLSAEKFQGHSEAESDSLEKLQPFEGCMPIEDMAIRGTDVLRYGPLKPVGLVCPKTGKCPYAVLQLRAEDKAQSMWNLVGMQTRMKQAEQRRIFRKLPGLENAEFVRLGSVHRNTFIQSPKLLSPSLEMRQFPGLFFAGQITGVEGY